MSKKPRFNLKEILDLFEPEHQVCYYCGQPITLENGALDHVIPQSRGGADVLQNIVPSCKSCNFLKNDKTEVEYYHWLGIANRLTKIEKSQETATPLLKITDEIIFTSPLCSQPEAITRFFVITWRAEFAGFEHVSQDMIDGYKTSGIIIATISPKGYRWHVGITEGPLIGYYTLKCRAGRPKLKNMRY